MTQPPRLRQQPADVLLREQVRGGALTTTGEHVRRRDLGRRVARLQVRGEPTRDPQPLRPLVRMHPDRQSGPSDRQLAGDRARTGGLPVADELAEQPLLLSQPSARRSRRYSSTCACRPLIAADPQATASPAAASARRRRARRSRCSANSDGAAPDRSGQAERWLGPSRTPPCAVAGVTPTSAIPARRHAWRTVKPPHRKRSARKGPWPSGTPPAGWPLKSANASWLSPSQRIADPVRVSLRKSRVKGPRLAIASAGRTATRPSTRPGAARCEPNDAPSGCATETLRQPER